MLLRTLELFRSMKNGVLFQLKGLRTTSRVLGGTSVLPCWYSRSLHHLITSTCD